MVSALGTGLTEDIVFRSWVRPFIVTQVYTWDMGTSEFNARGISLRWTSIQSNPTWWATWLVCGPYWPFLCHAAEYHILKFLRSTRGSWEICDATVSQCYLIQLTQSRLPYFGAKNDVELPDYNFVDHRIKILRHVKDYKKLDTRIFRILNVTVLTPWADSQNV